MRYYLVAIVSKPLVLTYTSEEKIEVGSLVEVKIKSKIYKGYVLEETKKPDFECKNIENITKFYLPKKYLEIAKFISIYYFCSIGEALGLFVPFLRKEDKLEVSSFKFQSQTSNFQLPTSNFKLPTSNFQLSSIQKEALKFIKSHQISLLFGDTGSGKTQIYMRYFEEVLKKNKSAIFLMPEISLTPQMESRLKACFGQSVAIWHSKITKKKKEAILEDIYSQKVKIVAGPRSTLFLPLKDLDLIVVDEEHDDSYKAHNRPRYHARDLALYFGKKLNINVVLGSATPSLTSYKNYPHFRLKGSYYGGEKEFIWDNSNLTLSPIILENLQKVLKEKKQTIIFLPTRANFKYLICQNCAKAIHCPYCDVGMSLHFDKRALICHYCNFAQMIPKNCPSCGSFELKANRIGTAEVVEELKEIFPKAKIKKFDRDEITTQNKLKKVLKEFSNKEIDILVELRCSQKGMIIRM